MRDDCKETWRKFADILKELGKSKFSLLKSLCDFLEIKAQTHHQYVRSFHREICNYKELSNRFYFSAVNLKTGTEESKVLKSMQRQKIALGFCIATKGTPLHDVSYQLLGLINPLNDVDVFQSGLQVGYTGLYMASIGKIALPRYEIQKRLIDLAEMDVNPRCILESLIEHKQDSELISIIKCIKTASHICYWITIIFNDICAELNKFSSNNKDHDYRKFSDDEKESFQDCKFLSEIAIELLSYAPRYFSNQKYFSHFKKYNLPGIEGYVMNHHPDLYEALP